MRKAKIAFAMASILLLSACGNEHNTDLTFNEQIKEAGMEPLPVSNDELVVAATMICGLIKDGMDRDELVDGLHSEGMNAHYTRSETETFVEIVHVNVCPSY